jgi:hypothetical protein
MKNTVTVENGLAAYFKWPTGQSRPGIDWAIRIEGERAGMVIVRTYFTSNPPQETEKKVLSEKAAAFVSQKLEQGWIPQPGTLLEIEECGNISTDTSKRPWWKIF